MLKVANVNFTYQEEPFYFDFEVKKGECLAIQGASGSGKTTLLNLIAGFLKPETGQIYFDNHRIDQLAPAMRPLTILFQEHNLFNHLAVFQNIALGLSPALKLSKDQIDIVNESMVQLGLAGMAQRLPESLSGGQRQRVALARCLVRSKPLLLLDEPFTGLNEELKLEIQSILAQLSKQLNLTMLWVTHDLDDVSQIANKIVTIKNRTLTRIFEGTP